MPRLMSVTLTEAAVIARSKTETRRLGWRNLHPGDQLDLCRKVMGRRSADGTVDPLVRLARVEVVEVRREPLDAITDAAVFREGVDLRGWYHEPGWSPAQAFVAFFTHSLKCSPDTEVTVIRWRYLDGGEG